MRRSVNFRKRIKWVDFEQTSWNTNSKLFEAAVCWTMWLTELNNEMKVYSRVQKIYRNINRPANFRDWMNAVDSKPFETVVFWTSWLTVTSKRIRIYIRVKTKIYETGKTCQFKEMHQMRLTWSKHHGTHTRNDLKRQFFERCGLQSLKNKKWIYIRIKTKTRKMRGPVDNFKK